MNLSVVLEHAVNASNSALQKEAEQALLTLLENEPQKSLLSFSEILASEAEADNVRHAAGTVICKNIFKKTTDGANYAWHTYDAQLTQQIKSSVLATLGSEKEIPKRSASDVISKIAVVDIPSGRWNDLIPALLNAAADQNPVNQRTAIMTLGFMCTEFKQYKVGITNHQTEQIFTAIFIGLDKENVEIKKTSLVAFNPCIIYMDIILNNQKFRQRTITSLLKCLSIPELIQPALEVFLEYAKQYYKYVGEIVEYLYTATEPIIKSCGEYSITAMELWHTIAEQYIERKNIGGTQNYIIPLGTKIVQLLLTCLLYCQKDGDNNVRQAAYRSLFPICEGCEAISLESVVMFVSNALHSSDWKFRQATMLAYSTISSSDNTLIKNGFETALDQFFGLLVDTDDFVIESSLTGFIKVLDNPVHSTMILKKKNYADYITYFTNLLMKKEEIAALALDALGRLTEVLPTLTCDLSNNTPGLLNMVSQFMNKSPTPSPRELQCASIVVIHLLQGNKASRVMKDYTEYIVMEAQKLRESVESENNLKSCYLIILHTALLSSKDPLEKQFCQTVCSMVHNHFQAISTVDQDGLYIVGALALRIEQDFYTYFQQFAPYIDHGLGLKKQPITYKVCVGVVCDIMKSIGHLIPQQIQKYLVMFLNDFSVEVDRAIKGPLLSGIGDLVREPESSKLFEKYANNIIQIAQLSVSACFIICGNNEDPDYAEELKDIITDFLQCLTSGAKDCPDKLSTILQIGIAFVLYTCKKQSNPSLSHFKKGILIVFDMASCMINTGNNDYMNMVKATFSDQAFIKIFNSLREIGYSDDVRGINSYGRAIFGALKIEGIKYVS